MLDDALDVVKTTRHQLGTFSHMSEGLDSTLEGLRRSLHEALDFFSRPVNASLAAAAVIAAVFVLALVRGRMEARMRWRGQAASVVRLASRLR